MIIVRGDFVMYKTLDGVEWIKPIATLTLNLDGRKKVYGNDAFDIGEEINNYYKSIGKKANYKSMAVLTNLGANMVYTNFVYGCPIFLPLKNSEPIIAQFLSPDGFRPNLEPPNNLDEILSEKQKM